MHCLICNKILMQRRYILDELCGTCYYSQNSVRLPDYFPEVEMLEFFRSLVLEKHNDAIRQCIDCKQVFPNTTQYFYRLGKRHYLRSNCKKCHNMKKS